MHKLDSQESESSENVDFEYQNIIVKHDLKFKIYIEARTGLLKSKLRSSSGDNELSNVVF